MRADTNSCPHCHSRHKAHLEATGGEYVCLLIPGYGSIRPSICLKCGTVYIPQNVLDYYVKREEQRWKAI